jgi:hypothetical protein
VSSASILPTRHIATRAEPRKHWLKRMSCALSIGIHWLKLALTNINMLTHTGRGVCRSIGVAGGGSGGRERGARKGARGKGVSECNRDVSPIT